MDPDIARALRQFGVDITTTIEAGLRTTSDEMQIEFLRRENRVMVTGDADFLRSAKRSSILELFIVNARLTRWGKLFEV
jgi:predicted nuclease of predicted toxin-antitoxin system